MGNGPSNFVNHSPAETIISGLDKGADKVAGTVSNTIWEVVGGVLLLLFLIAVGFGIYRYAKERREKKRALTEFQKRYLRNSYRLSQRRSLTQSPDYEEPTEYGITKPLPPPPYATYINI
nr:p14 [Reptilian orthoreovirus]